MQNIDTVERIYAAFARRDLDAVLAELAPDVTLVQEAPLPWGGTDTGRDRAAAFLGNLLTHIEPSLEIDELISSGDHVVQIGHTSGRVLCTGKRFRAREGAHRRPTHARRPRVTATEYGYSTTSERSTL